MMKQGKVLYGGDYNPEQWLERPDILEKDIEYMKAAGINTVTVGMFAWSVLEPECRLPRYLTKPRQRRSEWDMAGSDGISRVSAVFRGKSLLTNKMRII